MPGNSYKHPVKWGKMPKPLGDVAMPWVKVARGTQDVCWPWLGTLNGDGYGVFTVKGRQYRAHRVAYMDAIGVDPGPGLVVDHTCRNRACCNPHHMELVTLGENVHRSVHTLAVTCVRGHERTEDNIRRDAKGRRRGCLTCEREDRKARYARDKAAHDGGPGCPGQATGART